MEKFGQVYINRTSKKGYRTRLQDESKSSEGKFEIRNLMTELRDDALTISAPLGSRERQLIRQALSAASTALPSAW